MKEHLFTLESPDGLHSVSLTQEPPRRRTVLQHRRPVRIQTPWIQYMRVRSPLWNGGATHLLICGSNEPMRTADDPLMYVSMPHTMGSFCIGTGASFLGQMEIEEVFWNSAFVDGAVKPQPDLQPALVMMPHHPIMPTYHPHSRALKHYTTMPATPRLYVEYLADTWLTQQINSVYTRSSQYKRVAQRANLITKAREEWHGAQANIHKMKKRLDETVDIVVRAKFVDLLNKLDAAAEAAHARLKEIEASDPLGRDLPEKLARSERGVGR